MAAAELTPTQFTPLSKVVELGRVRQTHLRRLAAMDPATIQGVVRRLLDRDLVTRTADPLDKRAIVLTPARAGLALATRAVVAARGISEATLEPLAPEERVVFLRLLHRLC